jgi:hypothetical protein
LFLAQIVEHDLVAILSGRRRRRLGDGVVEASGVGMSEDDRDIH